MCFFCDNLGRVEPLCELSKPPTGTQFATSSATEDFLLALCGLVLFSSISWLCLYLLHRLSVDMFTIFVLCGGYLCQCYVNQDNNGTLEQYSIVLPPLDICIVLFLLILRVYLCSAVIWNRGAQEGWSPDS